MDNDPDIDKLIRSTMPVGKDEIDYLNELLIEQKKTNLLLGEILKHLRHKE